LALDADYLVRLRSGDRSVIAKSATKCVATLETFMFIKSLAMASAGLALVAAPVAASAAPANSAASLSVSKSVRASTPATKQSKVADSGLLIVALAAVAVGGGLYLAIDGDDDSDSN
jgi:hypothetical protein